MFQWHISWVELIVWGTMIFLETWVFFSLSLHTLDHSTEIESGKDTIMRNYMIFPMGFIIMVMLETCCIRSSKNERHKCVSIIDCIKLFSFHVACEIVLHNWILHCCSSLCSCCVDTNAITKGKNVREFLVLKCVWVNINNSLSICNTTWLEFCLWFTRWVNDCWEELFLDCLSSFSTSECCNLLSIFVIFYW